MQSILQNYKKINHEELHKLRTSVSQSQKHSYPELEAALEQAKKWKASVWNFASDAVTLGVAEDVDNHEELLQILRLFMPWKKGPFSLFGHFIDAEWRSDWKFARVIKNCSSLRHKRIADVGCANGYFMFRMLAYEPEIVVGFEPWLRNKLMFALLHQWCHAPQLVFEQLGLEHLYCFPNFFDTIFCLGVLYHRTDPVESLELLHGALRRGGELILECQGIEGKEPIALVPRLRYAHTRGIWFLPTVSCIENWLWRAKFRDIHCFYSAPLSTEEQRSTLWAPIKSLSDFLDPQNPQLTCEGYPAPWRHYFIARR